MAMAQRPDLGGDGSARTFWIRAALTTLLLALAIWWLFIASQYLSDAPRVDEEGNVALDEFQRAKDILLVVLPLMTAAAGYWFGAAGKERAENRADQASKDADNEKRKIQAILDSSETTGLLAKAMKKYPDAFGGQASTAEELDPRSRQQPQPYAQQ